MGLLKRIQLKGFKSIKSMDLELRALNVMIGANGSGKSNLIAYFKMLNAMVIRTSGLQGFVAESGYAQSLCHYGSKATPMIDGQLIYENDRGRYRYLQLLNVVPTEQLSFADEVVEFTPRNSISAQPIRLELGTGHPNSKLDAFIFNRDNGAFEISRLLRGFRPFQFNDTTSSSEVRGRVYGDDNRELSSNGRNLAAVLLRLKSQAAPHCYRRIVSTIRLIAPYFGDFDLSVENTLTLLNWREKDSDVLFGPHQISDGTLRAMCLITLLMLPDDQLPSIIIVDEPELGLHPYAIGVIASLFKSAAERTQVLISTQSTAFLDHFEPEDIIVVDRIGKESRFSRPDAAHYREWLEDYTVSQVWEKNIFGGGPH